MTLDPDDYPIDDNDLEQIFQDEVIPDELLIANPEPVESLLVVFFGGQPGSGKTQQLPFLIRETADIGGVAVVSTDNLRSFHPAFPELQTVDDVTASQALHPAGLWWRHRSTDWLRQAGYNILVEESFRGTDDVMARAHNFAEAGYHVRVAAMATPAALARLGIIERFCDQRETIGAGRLPHDYDLDFPAEVAVLARAEEAPYVNQVTVLTRDGMVHDKSRMTDGAWNSNVSAVDVAITARTPSFTTLQRTAFSHRLATTLDDLGKLGPIPTQVLDLAGRIHEDLSHETADLADLYLSKAHAALAQARTDLDNGGPAHQPPDRDARPPEPRPPGRQLDPGP